MSGDAVGTHVFTDAGLAAHDAAIRAEAWDERDAASPQYLGPNEGHYDGCMGWEDCDCATYPNPYRAAQPTEGES